MTIEHRGELRIVDRNCIRFARAINTENAEQVAETLWNLGYLSRITRPTLRQLKKDDISFFASVEVRGAERKIPIVVRASVKAAQKYISDHTDSIKRKGIIVLVARDDMEPQTILNKFREGLSRDLKIQLPVRAGVADLPAGRQGWSTQ